MKSKKHFRILIVIITLLFSSFSCQRVSLVEIRTMEITEITKNSAISGGIIKSDGGAAITMRGVCWSENPTPLISDFKTEDGEGNVPFESIMTGMEPQTTYYVRAYAVNDAGTAYGEEIVFKSCKDYIYDLDGNGYGTVEIGDQEWITANLKTTKYNDGTPILHITGDAEWAELSTGAYCWYKHNNEPYRLSYGALYNWYAVNTGKLCPDGWHVPSDEEWTALAAYIDPSATLHHSLIAGGKLKSTRTIPMRHPRWEGSNFGATDYYGFSGFAGGYRDEDGRFEGGYNTYYIWASTQESELIGRFRGILSMNGGFNRSSLHKRNAFSVRCLRD